MKLSPRSEEKLVGVHPDLVAVIRRAAGNTSQPFIVTEGVRTRERQVELVKAGKSRTLNSRHCVAMAVDLAVLLPDGGISWERDQYKFLSRTVKVAAVELGIPIVCGADWIWFDGPHVELSRQFYPDPVPNLQPEGATQT
jgi:peptidoglycan L-alanyl-D-glutamate endopeptidase CwlK